MTDETEVQETTEDTTDETTEQTPPESGVSDSGDQPAEQAPDWRTMVGDKWQKEAARFTSLDDVFEARDNFRKMADSRIKLPGEDADEAELAKFRKAIGVPEDDDGYAVSVPEEMELTEADEAFIAALRPVARDNNIPAPFFDAAVSKVLEFSRQAATEQAAQIAKARDEAKSALEKEWGGEYQANVNIANNALRVVGGEDFIEYANTTKTETGELLANSPQMVKLFAKLGRQISEDGMIERVDADTAKDLRTQMNDKIIEMHKANDSGNKALAQKLNSEIQNLSERIVGDAPVVGAQGRGI